MCIGENKSAKATCSAARYYEHTEEVTFGNELPRSFKEHFADRRYVPRQKKFSGDNPDLAELLIPGTRAPDDRQYFAQVVLEGFEKETLKSAAIGGDAEN